MTGNDDERKRLRFDCRLSYLYAVLMTSWVLALAGCGGDGRVPASGVVLIDGKPLTHGRVQVHVTGARPSSGRLDQDGRFVLGSHTEDDGVLPGTYPVSIDASEWIGPRSVKWHAPKKYKSKNSGLEVSVSDESDDLQINLTWDGAQPFVEDFGAEGGS